VKSPISTPGKGSFTAKLEDNNTLSYTLKFSNLEGKPSVAHIHFGQPLVSGGVIAFLCGEGGKPACTPDQEISGTISPPDIVGPQEQGIAPGEFEEVLRAIRAGTTYVNVHSDKFPKGEIRGQIWLRRFGFGPLDDLLENN
jgi:CHRD domain-containing protein